MSFIQKGHPSLRMLSAGAAIALALLALRLAFQPVFSLTPFVSPPVTITGQRVELLIPAGWMSDSMDRLSFGLPCFVIEPDDQRSAAMTLLHRLRLVSDERMARIWITVRRRSFPESDAMRQVFETKVNRETTFVADATMPIDQDHEV